MLICGSYINVTNQPISHNGQVCDQQIHLWNSSISTDKNAPVGVKGDVKIAKKYLGMGGQGKGGFEAKGVSGVKVDVAFIENNMIPCKELKGYEFS